MNPIDLNIFLRNKSTEKLTEEEIMQRVHESVIESLKDCKRGNLMSKIYELKAQGLTQKEIALECRVSDDVVYHYMNKIRMGIAIMRNLGVDISQFKCFDYVPKNKSTTKKK